MKLLLAVLSFSFLFVGCEPKKPATPGNVEYEDPEPGMVGVPPKPKAKPGATPTPKPGDWRFNKERGNPLEQRPK